MPSLKPAHEIIVDRITAHCNALKAIDNGVAGLMPRAVGVFVQMSGRSQEIGGLCSLCDVLQWMVIPADKLDEVIDRLAKLDYNHAVISSTVKELSQRRVAA